MNKWILNILFFIFFAATLTIVQQNNIINNLDIVNFLSDEKSSHFISEINDINHYDCIQLLKKSNELNAQMQLKKKKNIYLFSFTSIYDSKIKWSIKLEKDGDFLILKAITGLENYNKAIACY